MSNAAEIREVMEDIGLVERSMRVIMNRIESINFEINSLRFQIQNSVAMDDVGLARLARLERELENLEGQREDCQGELTGNQRELDRLWQRLHWLERH